MYLVVRSNFRVSSAESNANKDDKHVALASRGDGLVDVGNVGLDGLLGLQRYLDDTNLNIGDDERSSRSGSGSASHGDGFRGN